MNNIKLDQVIIPTPTNHQVTDDKESFNLEDDRSDDETKESETPMPREEIIDTKDDSQDVSGGDDHNSDEASVSGTDINESGLSYFEGGI